MGFFSNLATEKYDREYTDKELVVRIISYFKPYRLKMLTIAIWLIFIAMAAAAVPLLVSKTIDEMATDTNSASLMWLGGIVFFSGLFVWIGNWIRRRMTSRAIGDVVKDVRVDAFRATATHDLSFYDEFSSGKIVSRITSDTREFGQVINLVTDLASQFFQALILAAALIIIEPKLMMYLGLFLPLIFLVAMGFRKIARSVTQKGMRAMGNVNAAIKETVSGIGVAKNFRQENLIFAEFDEANTSSYKVNLRRGIVLATFFPTLNALSGVGTAIMLYLGGMEVARGLVSMGAWFLFLQSLDRFWFPILQLSAFWAQLQAGLSAAERSFALIDAESKVAQSDKITLSKLEGEIKFSDVDFNYSDQEIVLEKFNLHIKKGETIALVGHTGAGKSSIAKLVSRFYEFQGGSLTIDGHDIRTLDLIEYRKKLGIVSQVPFLFSGTVAENIRYANKDITDEEILKWANQIGNGEWVQTLSEGLLTQVGERGGRLSMGQRQLISLLRVLVEVPAIFILDEATASIDPFTEWQIQQGLNLILSNTTSIIIAHRLSTIKAADRIVVLDNGKIIEEGDHDYLISLNGNYADLYNTYFRHQSLAYVEDSKNQALQDE
jgi:ATP-binding cassette, subfamily B, bacterial